MRLKHIIKNTILAPALITSNKHSVGKCALTFDDGPDVKYTPLVLDLLSSHNAKATFFLVGEKISEHADIARLIMEQGHEIGNHSFSHKEFSQLSFREIEKEINGGQSSLQRFGLQPASHGLFRPPKGVVNLRLLLHCLLRRRRLCLWSLDPEDFKAENAHEIEMYFASNPICSGDIILMHDKNKYTVEALDKILATLRSASLQAVTVSSLLGK